MLRSLTLPTLALLLVACGDDTTTGTTDSSTTGATDSGATTTDSGTTSDTVTWHADIDPLLQTKCSRCHYDGGLGTGDFTDYDTAKAMAEVMVAQIDAGWMPPPTSDPECRDYHGSDAMHVDDSDRDLLQTWIDAGAPEGDPADAVEVDPLKEELEDPDLVLMLPEPYTPTFSDPSNPGNEYRCFVIEDVPEEDYYVSSFHPIIDNRAMSHHVVLYTARESGLTDAHKDPAGFDCIDGEEFSVITSFAGGWAPGDLPVELPEGVAMKFNGGQPLIIQMHYFDPGTLEPDTSDHPGYAFKLVDSAEKIARFETWGTTRFDIPPGEEAYEVSGSTQSHRSRDITIYAVWPHMHLLGWEAHMTITPTGSEDEDCLVSGRYNFNNQVPYYFKEPYEAPAKSTVDYTCVFNNSESNPNLLGEPKETGYGERTDEEMCWFFTLATTD